MDEFILDDNEQSTETVLPSTESVETDKSDSENTVVTDSDRVSDSISSDDVEDVTNASVETPEESEGAQVGEEQPETFVYFNEDLGAYPVYLVDDGSDDVMALANYSDYYTYLPTQLESYFSGVLDNIGDTDYIAFAYRHYYNDYNNNYIDYYRLVYNLDIQNDGLVSDNYPCITVSKESSYNSGYIQTEETYNLTSVPSFAYGSFGHVSDLRKGVSHNETWAVLFFLGFFTVYVVLRGIFDFILKHYK